MRLRRGETVTALSPHRLASLLPVSSRVIICAVLAGFRLRLRSALCAALRSGCRSTAGAQIITVEAQRKRARERLIQARQWVNGPRRQAV